MAAHALLGHRLLVLWCKDQTGVCCVGPQIGGAPIRAMFGGLDPVTSADILLATAVKCIVARVIFLLVAFCLASLQSVLFQR